MKIDRSIKTGVTTGPQDVQSAMFQPIATIFSNIPETTTNKDPNPGISGQPDYDLEEEDRDI